MIEQALCPTLVGRDRELDALEDALLAALRGEGGLGLLGGEAGLGKSRLAARLRERAERLGTLTLWGGCSEAELALPYLPFVEALGNHVDAVGPAPIRERLGAAARDLASMLPALGFDEAPEGGPESAQAKLRLFEAVFQLLRAEGAGTGLLLVVEDIHWADASTRELLDFLARRLRATRVLMLATYRRDELHRRHPLTPLVQGWRRGGAAKIVELEPFGSADVAEMIGAILDTDEVSPEFRDLLLQRSEGNPFVLEEMLKDAMDRGDLYRSVSGWERRAIGELRLPATVRDTILQRVERLSAAAVDILRAAAVLGSTVEPDLLPAVSGRSMEEVEEALEVFVNEQLLDADPGAGRYRFRHALTREAVYDDIVLPRRGSLHSRVADALAVRPQTPAVDRALHLLAAGRFAEAVPVCLEAAREAEEHNGDREAAELYLRALPHVTDDGQRGTVLVRLGRAMWLAGETAAAQPYLVDGIALLEATGKTAAAANGHLVLGRVLWEQSRQDHARLEYDRARVLLEPLGPSEDLANAYVRLASLHAFDYEPEALALLEQAIVIADAAGAEASRIWALGFRGLTRVQMGDLDSGFADMELAYRQAMERRLMFVATNTIYNEAAIRVRVFGARRALELCDLMDRAHPQFPPGMQTCLGRMFALQALGDLEGSHENAERVIAVAREHGQNTFEWWGRYSDAQTLAYMGRPAEADARLRDRPKLLQRQNIVAFGQAAVIVDLLAGRVDEAAEVAVDALDALGWPRPLSPDTMSWLDVAAEALVAAGRLDEARRIAGGLEERRLDAGGVCRLLTRSRLAIAEGRGRAALPDLRTAVDCLDGVGYVIDAARARAMLAEALLASGDRTAAVREATSAVEAMDAHRGDGVAASIRARMAAWGMQLVPATARPLRGEAPGSLPEAAKSPTPEERLVTVLFVDIRGYTAFAIDAVPESLADRVGSFHRWARAEIENEGGLVDKFAGDAVMATFNVVSPRLDHAVAAVRAAMGIHDKAAAAGFAVGAGIAVGPVVVGALTRGANVSAIGTPTNLASRLQAQAAGGEVLLSDEAYRRAAAWLEERGLAAERRDVVLKGFDAPMAAWSVGRS